MAIKTGATIPDNAMVKLSDSPYLGMAHSNGYTVELKEGPGEVNLADHVKEGGSDGVVKKYTDYISKKINDDGSINRLAATGAVERATTTGFDVFLPKKASFYEESAEVSWETIDGAESYHIAITDMMGTVVHEEDVAETFTTVDLSELKGPLFLLKVKGSNGVASIEYAITPTAPAKRSEIEAEITELKSAVEVNSSMNALIYAEFYERNDCMVDAASYYRKAVDLSPDVEYFQEMLEEFAARN